VRGNKGKSKENNSKVKEGKDSPYLKGIKQTFGEDPKRFVINARDELGLKGFDMTTIS
jgi:hypothetical protein